MTALHFFVSSLLATCAAADTLQLAPSQDNTLYDDGLSGALSNGVGIGVFSGVTNAGNVRRALLQFDLSAIPHGAVVHTVELRLRITQSISPGQEVELYRVLAPWGEGQSGGTGAGGNGAPAADCDATWLHRFYPGATCVDTRWATPGGDLAAVASERLVAGNLGTFVIFSASGLVADVQAWVDGSAANHGWLVRHVDELTGLTAKRFGSREAMVLDDRPRLTIEYTPPGTSTFCTPASPSSVSPSGSALTLEGSRSIALNDNVLVAAIVPSFPGLCVQGSAQMPAVAAPFGGSLCLGGSLGRFPVRLPALGVARQALDFTGQGVEAVVLAGQTWHYQWVHRDTTPGGGNLSAGLAVTWLL